jgi:hypothetical protein
VAVAAGDNNTNIAYLLPLSAAAIGGLLLLLLSNIIDDGHP